MSEQVLITGGAGFIGSHLARRQLSEGKQVRVLDNLSSGFLSNLSDVSADIEFQKGDVEDESAAIKATTGIDTVFHLAALGSVPRSIAAPVPTHLANATGTLSMLEAAKIAGVRRFVFASSSSVYGDHPDLPKQEPATGSLLSPYAVSKRMGEEYCRLSWELNQLETVALRFFNVFGPRQRADHVYAAVIPRFVSAALCGNPLPIHGDGLQSRDFTYVANNVDGIVAAADAEADAVAGRTFNLACEGQFTLLDVVGLLESSLGTELEKEWLDARAGDIRHSFADTSRLRTATGFTPRVTVAEGLSETVAWFNEGCP